MMKIGYVEDYITMLPNLRSATKRCSRMKSLIREYKIRAALSAACITEGHLEQHIAEISGCSSTQFHSGCCNLNNLNIIKQFKHKKLVSYHCL